MAIQQMEGSGKMEPDFLCPKYLFILLGKTTRAIKTLRRDTCLIPGCSSVGAYLCISFVLCVFKNLLVILLLHVLFGCQLGQVGELGQSCGHDYVRTEALLCNCIH